MADQLHVAYIGNFGVSHSTENHVRQALEHLGHDVTPLQENDLSSWHQLLADEALRPYDLLLWTRTGWDPPIDHQLQYDVLAAFRDESKPTVGFHLDRWWGLDRQQQVLDEPFFTVDLLATADGGHEREYAQAGVEHWWAPPGVSEFECVPSGPSRRFQSEVAFVGSWQSYHDEWRHRFDLVAHLRKRYRGRVRFYPQPGRAAVRGDQLRQLYASVQVVVGDSCLLGDHPGEVATRYWSDRIPETLGRGGFLLHPYVDGLAEHFDLGRELVCWPLGDWAALDDLIGYYLAHPAERMEIAEAGRRRVLADHTYTVRMRQLLDETRRRGLL